MSKVLRANDIRVDDHSAYVLMGCETCVDNFSIFQ